ncbi:MAG: hypothetical protein DGJ47_000112 [Rickettsiaceae bacterium]
MALFFYIFAAMSIIGALCVVNSKNPVHSVLWLIFTFCNGSGLLVLIGAEFIAMMLIIIYVGAVAVLFLFVVMMLNVNRVFIQPELSSEVVLSLSITICLGIDLAFVALISSDVVIDRSQYGFAITPELGGVKLIGQVLYTDFILPFQTSGIILFVAMISSIALTLRLRKGVKKQNVKEQISRNKENGMAIAKQDGKQGLKDISYDS